MALCFWYEKNWLLKWESKQQTSAEFAKTWGYIFPPNLAIADQIAPNECLNRLGIRRIWTRQRNFSSFDLIYLWKRPYLCRKRWTKAAKAKLRFDYSHFSVSKFFVGHWRLFLNLGTGNWEPKWGNEFIYIYYPNNNFQAVEDGKRKASRRRPSMPHASRTHGE